MMLFRLYILDFGLFRVHSDNRLIGIPGYLLQTTTGQNILVDTGFPAKYVIDPAGASAEDGLDAFGSIVTLTADNLPTAQLARCGLAISDIDTIILTHTHIDHVGSLPYFAHANIIVGAAERALPAPLYWNDRSPIAWPAARYTTIDHDYTLLPGLQLLTTPGHSLGHLSLLLTLPNSGTLLLTGDAISRPAEVKDQFVGSWDPPLAQASAARLLNLAEQQQAHVIYGHCPEQWPTLRKAPDYFD